MPDQEHKVGENGVELRGSKTIKRNGPRERLDIENPNPGSGDGNIHYHDPNNQKWDYNLNTKQLFDHTSGKPAPPRIQKVLSEEWFKKALEKALKYLGEDVQ